MKLKEFMRDENLSESDIIEAARVVNALCRNLTACKICPLNNGSRCIATRTGGVNIVGIIKERMKELLTPNHMDKVAELLGVKLGSEFTVTTIANGIINHYHITENGLYDNEGVAANGTLTNLLTGKAYIVKEEERVNKIHLLTT